MKKVVLLAVACMLAGQANMMVFASDRCAPQQCMCCDNTSCTPDNSRFVPPQERLAKDLNLTAEQKEKFFSIRKETRESIKAEVQKSRDSIRAIQNESDNKIKAILTAEQSRKFDEIRAKRVKEMDKRMMKNGKGCR